MRSYLVIGVGGRIPAYMDSFQPRIGICIKGEGRGGGVKVRWALFAPFTLTS